MHTLLNTFYANQAKKWICRKLRIQWNSPERCPSGCPLRAQDGCTALHMAVVATSRRFLELADHLELVWELLAAGADATKADKVRGAQQMGISR